MDEEVVDAGTSGNNSSASLAKDHQQATPPEQHQDDGEDDDEIDRGGDATPPAVHQPPAAVAAAPAPSNVVTVQTARDLTQRCNSVLRRRGWAQQHAQAAQLLAELGRGELGRGECLRDGEVVAAAEAALEEQAEMSAGSLETAVQVRNMGL